jgi:hypothetical protein
MFHHVALTESMQSFEQVLKNINKLNRSLEGVIAVRSVYWLVWERFEAYMVGSIGRR